MKQQLQDSKNVRLDGFGTFRIGLKTKPSVSPEEFNASKNAVVKKQKKAGGAAPGGSTPTPGGH